MERSIVWMDQIGRMEADKLLGLVSQDIAGGGRHIPADAVERGSPDHVGGVLAQQTVERLALRKRGFGSPARGDVGVGPNCPPLGEGNGADLEHDAIGAGLSRWAFLLVKGTEPAHRGSRTFNNLAGSRSPGRRPETCFTYPT